MFCHRGTEAQSRLIIIMNYYETDNFRRILHLVKIAGFQYIYLCFNQRGSNGINSEWNRDFS